MTFRPKQPYVQPDVLRGNEIKRSPEQKVIKEIRDAANEHMDSENFELKYFPEFLYNLLNKLDQKYNE